MVDGELALAFERGVEGLGSRVLLQRRQKVFGHHHGGAAGVGGGPAPIAARGLYMRQASGLHAPLRYQPLGVLHVFLRPVGSRSARRQALQKRAVVQALAYPVDPAPGDGGHHAVVPRHAGLACGLFENAHPQLRLVGVVGLQPYVELFLRFKGVVRGVAHVLIAACAYSAVASDLFGT